MASSKKMQQTSPMEEPLPFPSELDQPRWSVITFDECAARGLSYDEAKRLVEQMSDEVPGLCIVTDDAAQKLFPSNKPKTIKTEDEDLSQKTFQEAL
jgi:hypothetical protein